MDIRMPQLDGLSATRRVLGLPEPPRVLVLTTVDRNEWVDAALRAGGEALLSPSITRRLIEDFVSRRPSAQPAAAPDVLTEREAQVLRLLAAALPNAEIAARLFVGHSTVQTHVTRLLTELELRDRAQAVVYAYESGFVQPGGSAE